MKKYLGDKLVLSVFVILMLSIFLNSYCFAVEKFPIRPVTLICPFNTGGGVDLTARTLQLFLREALDAPAVIVENKPGGNALMGTVDFLNRKADGYTLFVIGSEGLVLNKLLMEDASYVMEDFAPVIGVTSDPRTFFVQKDSPYNTVEDLINEIRKRPGEISLAFSAGAGQWLEEWLKKKLNLPVNLIGFSGGGPATTALIGGHVNAYMDAGAARVPFKDNIKAIGVVYPERTKNWPDAIPILELGLFKKEGIDYVPGMEVANNVTIWVHRNVREDYPERFYRLVSAFYEVAKNPEFKKRAIENGIDSTLVWLPPSEVDKIVASTVEIMKEDPELLKLMKQ